MTKTSSGSGRPYVLLVTWRGTWARPASAILQTGGFLVHQAFSAKDARDALSRGKVRFVISDIYLRDENGFQFSRRAKEISPTTEVYLASSNTIALQHARMLISRASRPSRSRTAQIVRPLFGS